MGEVTIECLCGAKVQGSSLMNHLHGHDRGEIEDMLHMWLMSEAQLDEAFSRVVVV